MPDCRRGEIVMFQNFWFTSDTHFDHANIIRYSNRPFADVDEMNEALIANWNACVKPGDVVYHLGDFALARKVSSDRVRRLRERLHGSIHLVVGNHDSAATVNADCWTWVGDYKRIKIAGQRIVLLHYAMRVWHGQHRGAWHLYGHSHGNLPDDPESKSFDVGVDACDYRPVHFDEVAERMANKTFVPVDHHA